MEKVNILSLDIKDKHNKIHTLSWVLYDTTLVQKYLRVLDENKKIADGNIDSHFNNKVEADYPELCNEIKTLVKTLNQTCDYMTLPEYDVINQKELNHLHELFEEWGQSTANQQDRSLAKNFLRLNDLIHMCEDTFTSGEVMGAIVDVKPTTESGRPCKRYLVTDKDKLFLTSQYKWGSLYLGYNTLGKDYLAAMKDNDIRLIHNNQVKPQRNYAAEIWLNFGPDQKTPTAFNFSKWLDDIDEDTRKKIPLDNIQQLSLGRFLIGELIIDEQFINIDGKLDHWNTDNHNCKLRFNKEIFSTFRKVVDIRITDDWFPNELIEFVTENKKRQWKPSQLPNNVWKSNWPWAPVFVDINENKVREELDDLDRYFVPHRDKDRSGGYGHEGWYGITLHGIGHSKTQNYEQYGYKTQEDADYHWTSICNRCPYIVRLIKSLPFSKFDRVRIMRLSPGGYIMPHKDGEGRIFGPLNIALTQPKGCDFVFEDRGIVPFKPGRGFMLDLGRRHSVVNWSEEYRYHIIVHGTPSGDIGSVMTKSLEQL